MSNSKIVLILGLALLGSFALPWLGGGDETYAGYQVLKIWLETEAAKVAGYILVAAPIGALLVILLGATGKPHGLLSFLTGLVVPLVVLFTWLGANQSGDDPFAAFRVGIWVATGISAVLLIFAFTKSDSRIRAQR